MNVVIVNEICHFSVSGTKKQAPAPPKHTTSATPQSVKMASNQPTAGQASAPSFPQPLLAPRRSNQTLIQAPSHPPPQPPPQPSPQSTEEPDPSPPRTPTPPGTPPHDSSQTPLTSYPSGSLPRPRPTPRTRPKPTGPPPPQPTSDGANGVCVSGSKIISGKNRHFHLALYQLVFTKARFIIGHT